MPRTTCCDFRIRRDRRAPKSPGRFGPTSRDPPLVLGTRAYGERALELGCAVSFSGLVFRRGEEASAEVARLVPDDRLLVETDCP